MPVFTGNWFGFGRSAAEEEVQDPISATGGASFTVGSYTYHLFASSGDFDVSTAPTSPSTSVAEVVVFGGGGSGGFFHGDGGGAGGGLYAPTYPLSVGPYKVVIGTGANAVPNSGATNGNAGADSEFYPTPATNGPGPMNMYANGGGGGGMQGNKSPGPFPFTPPSAGCGGGLHDPGTPSTPTFPTSTQHPAVTARYGTAGGRQSATSDHGSGGGGMGQAGEAGPGGDGGNGQPFGNFPGPGMFPNMPNGPTVWGTDWRDALGSNGLVGGGGAGHGGSTARPPGGGGAINPGPSGGAQTQNAIDYTGGGGGGPSNISGPGGKGCIMLRYKTLQS